MMKNGKKYHLKNDKVEHVTLSLFKWWKSYSSCVPSEEWMEATFAVLIYVYTCVCYLCILYKSIQKSHQSSVVSCLRVFCTPIYLQILVPLLASFRDID